MLVAVELRARRAASEHKLLLRVDRMNAFFPFLLPCFVGVTRMCRLLEMLSGLSKPLGTREMLDGGKGSRNW
jgi:hypothetical protein